MVEAVGSASRLDPPAGVAFAGRYRIIDLLGEGDRKRTYLALDTNLERKVALSLIKSDAALSDPEGTRREVEIPGQAGSHDNIVTLHDSGVFDGTEYLVLEFLPGGRALELVPLIRVIAGVKTGEDAVYFYNRRVRDGVRWVSYHFSGEPELILDDPDLDELLSDLRSADTGAKRPA